MVDYQGYSYLLKNKPEKAVQPFKVALDQPFAFKGKSYLLTTERQATLTEVGNFWLEKIVILLQEV